jgi:high-affinity iron transporter
VGGTFVITLREGFEAALVLGLIYTYLEKLGARREFRYVTVGALLGVAASILLGIAVTILSGPLVDLGLYLVSAIVLFAASSMLTWHGWWMRRHAQAIRGDLERRIDAAQVRQQLWVVGIIAFTGVFREGAETVLFLWGLLTQAGGERGWLAARARRAPGRPRRGIARRARVPRRAAAQPAALFRVDLRAPPPAGAGLFSTGVGRLHGLGILPSADILWDTSGWLDERGFLGSLLSGLLGYRARPSTWEAVAYAAYLVVAGWLFFGGSPSSAAPAARRADPVGGAPETRGAAERLTSGAARR